MRTLNGFFGVLAAVTMLLCGCGDDELTGGSSSTSSGGGAGGGGGGGGAGVEEILEGLRMDRDGTLFAYAAQTGWPVAVDGGFLFVCVDPNLDRVAGDHDAWAGTAMNEDSGFRWVVIDVPKGDHYKFTNLVDFVADPWARSYTYDGFGEMSLVLPSEKHLDRYFGIGDAVMEPRMVRVWIPAEPIERVIYVHDGQNLFDPEGPWGGWHLQDSAPPGMLLVGIDNTPARIDEYTHVEDQIDGSGQWFGGDGDAYADFVQSTVRPLIQGRFGETGPIGVMGSSLGGLISFHVADRYPGEYAFAASLSGTMGWGSIGPGVQNETMIQRYAAHAQPVALLYLDSGGGPGSGCVDADADGTADDTMDAADNYCENEQMRVRLNMGGIYAEGVNFSYVWVQDAEHNEAAWAARVGEPLGIFAGL
jgi:pimeloyl-ACP methyl ester carboxylesterase